jgi:hypothetical protein
MSNPLDVQAGDFVTETLWTDTIVHYVVKATEKSIWLVRAKETGVTASRSNGSPFPIVFRAVDAPDNIDHAGYRVGLRKDGTFRTMQGGRPLRKAETMHFDGLGERPYSRVDYSY